MHQPLELDCSRIASLRHGHQAVGDELVPVKRVGGPHDCDRSEWSQIPVKFRAFHGRTVRYDMVRYGMIWTVP